MALRRLVTEVALRCGGAPSTFALRSVAIRGFATVEPGLLYAKSHEWVKVEDDTATVGISDHAQELLGDVVYVELPPVGTIVEKDSDFAVIESVKAASDVFSPVTGKVVAVNKELAGSPELVNSGPFTDGWLIKVSLSANTDTSDLLDHKAYAALCAEDDH